MKDIRISNTSSLHVYLIDNKNVSDNLFECVYEHESRRADVMPNKAESFGYEKSAKDFIEAMDGNYCRATLMAFADVFVKSIVEDCERFCPQVLERKEYQPFLEYLKAREIK